MDHDEVIEALELAAAEPGGLDRLMAGDTATAMAVGTHLVGCATCGAELERLRAVSSVVRDVVSTTPPDDLRERTLAHVRAHGVPRTQVAAPAAATVATSVPVAPAPLAASPRASRGILPWVAAVAAAVLISVALTSIIVGARVDDRLAEMDREAKELAAVTAATLAVTAQPDATRVALDSPSGPTPNGTLVYSPSTTDVVVVATGLTEPAAGTEYRCWAEVGGDRQGVGRMFFGGGLAYWVGPSPAVAGADDDVTFGVSLVDADGAVVDPDPVLVSGT